MKLGIFIVGPLEPAWSVSISAKDVVIYQDMIRTECFCARGESLYSAGIGADFVVGQNNAYLQVNSGS